MKRTYAEKLAKKIDLNNTRVNTHIIVRGSIKLCEILNIYSEDEPEFSYIA